MYLRWRIPQNPKLISFNNENFISYLSGFPADYPQDEKWTENFSIFFMPPRGGFLQ